jgi:hypothetical protein
VSSLAYILLDRALLELDPRFRCQELETQAHALRRQRERASGALVERELQRLIDATVAAR